LPARRKDRTKATIAPKRPGWLTKFAVFPVAVARRTGILSGDVNALSENLVS